MIVEHDSFGPTKKFMETMTPMPNDIEESNDSKQEKVLDLRDPKIKAAFMLQLQSFQNDNERIDEAQDETKRS